MSHLLLTLLLSSSLALAQLAFPEAEGPGARATGGRGKSVFIVTNTNAEGPGSLADAVSAPDRFIVFAVSGVIDLTQFKDGQPVKGGRLTVGQPNLTIAGQTAPGEGICIKGGSLTIAASNVIVRHIRVRRGFIREGDSGDAVEINPKDPNYVKPKFKGTEKDKSTALVAAGKKLELLQNILLDHVSSSWATDENFTMSGHIHQVHAQHCFIAEGLDYTNPKQTPQNHAFGSLFGGAGADSRVAMHHCVYAHHRRRTPQCSAGDGSGDPPVLVDFRNNVVYDSIEAMSHTGGHPIRLSFVGNYYRAGPSTETELKGKWFTLQKSEDSQLYAEGNVVHDYPAVEQDNWTGVILDKKLKLKPSMVTKAPFPVATVTTQSAAAAFAMNLELSGATLPSRDAIDTRVARQVAEGKGRVIGKETDLPETQRWPTYHSLPALPDADSDGMPDSWETAFGLNPLDAADASLLSHSGYSNVEHYVNHTDPTGSTEPLFYVSAHVSRASAAQPGEFRIWRGGDLSKASTVRYQLGERQLQVELTAGTRFITVKQPGTGQPGKVWQLTLLEKRSACPSCALVVEE